jgi:hypothetical protein
MWLRDSLSHDLPSACIIIYGYDTQLHGSRSFQDLEALGGSLRGKMEAMHALGKVRQSPRLSELETLAKSGPKR